MIRAALIACTLAAPASAQTACADRAAIVKRLAEKYGESVQGLGIHNNNGVIEIYVSEETGTWTILITTPNGMTCLMAAGQSWMFAPKGEPL